MITLFSCGIIGGDDLEEISRLIEEGKSRLSEADYLGARVHFEQVVDEYDPFHSQAQFGLVLADLLEIGDQAAEMTQFALGGGSDFIPLVDQPGNQQVYEAVRGILENLRSRLQVISTRLTLVSDESSFRFTVESAPIFQGEDTVLELGGEYDSGDLFFLDALVSLLLGGLEQALSVNFLADYLGLFDFASRYLSRELISGEMDFSLMSGFAVYLMKDPDYPEFLDCVEPGEASLAQAGEWFGRAGQSLLTAISRVEEREGTADSHPFFYRDTDGDGSHDDGEPVVFPQYQPAPGEVVSLELTFTPESREGIRVLVDSFVYPDLRVSVSDHLLPMLGVMFFGGSEMLGIPEEVGETLWNQAAGVIGDHLELRLGYFFQNPVCPRDLLPAWSSTRGRDEVFANGDEFSLDLFREANRFLIEWDACEYIQAVTSFICPETGTDDRGHFQDSGAFVDFPGIQSIPADGIISSTPYLPLPDPSLNQLLWVDMSGLPDGQGGIVSEDAFHPADLFEVNTLLAHYTSLITPWLEYLPDDWGD